MEPVEQNANRCCINLLTLRELSFLQSYKICYVTLTVHQARAASLSWVNFTYDRLLHSTFRNFRLCFICSIWVVGWISLARLFPWTENPSRNGDNFSKCPKIKQYLWLCKSAIRAVVSHKLQIQLSLTTSIPEYTQIITTWRRY